MSSAIFLFIFWIVIAPLLPGLITKIKSLAAGRKGPPIWQLYADLWKLSQKETVLSHHATPGFLLAPFFGWLAVLGCLTFFPGGKIPALCSFQGDFLLFLYLLAFGRFCSVWAALETGSAFEGMGAAREVSYAVFSEIGLIIALITLSLHARSTILTELFTPLPGAVALMTGIGLFLIMLAETCRVPFDDPNTHLELTMIHEALILDHSGPALAAITHGAAAKLLLFTLLIAQTVLPLAKISLLPGFFVLLAGMLTLIVLIGVTESIMARLAFARVPLLLTTGILFCLFPLLGTWMGIS